MDFLKAPFQVFKVSHPKSNGYGIKLIFLKRNIFRITLQEFNSFAQIPFRQFSPAFAEHSFCNVDADDLDRIERKRLYREISCARRHIEDVSGLAVTQHSNRFSAPTTVYPEAQQVIEKVVPAADAIEHPGYLLLFSSGFVLVWNYRHHFPRKPGREVTTFQTE